MAVPLQKKTNVKGNKPFRKQAGCPRWAGKVAAPRAAFRKGKQGKAQSYVMQRYFTFLLYQPLLVKKSLDR